MTVGELETSKPFIPVGSNPFYLSSQRSIASS